MFSSLFSLTKIPHVSTVLEMADLISLANRRCGNSVSVSLNLIFFFGEFFFFLWEGYFTFAYYMKILMFYGNVLWLFGQKL